MAKKFGPPENCKICKMPFVSHDLGYGKYTIVCIECNTKAHNRRGETKEVRCLSLNQIGVVDKYFA